MIIPGAEKVKYLLFFEGKVVSHEGTREVILGASVEELENGLQWMAQKTNLLQRQSLIAPYDKRLESPPVLGLQSGSIPPRNATKMQCHTVTDTRAHRGVVNSKAIAHGVPGQI